MALTTYRVGDEAKAGINPHTNEWDTNTGVALSTGDGFEILPEGSPRTSAVLEAHEALHGVGIQKPPCKVGEMFEGDVAMYLGFENNASRFLANLFGTDTVTDLTNAYTHDFTWDEDVSLLHYTLGWTDRATGHDVQTCKTETFTVTIEAGAKARAVAGVLAYNELQDDSGANTLAAMNSNITLPTQPSTKYPLISNTVVRFNAASGAALADGDKRYPNKITLVYARSFKRRQTTRNGMFIDEPVSGGWKVASGTLEFPVDEITADFTNTVAATEMKMDIVSTGAIIGATAFSNEWKFEYPSLVFSTDGLAQLDNPDLLTISLPFTAHVADSAPSGMTATTPVASIQDSISTAHTA